VHDYGGVSRNVIIGWSFIDGFHPDDKEMARQVWTDCIKTGTPYELEARLRDKDGNYRWFIIRGLPGRDESGQIVKWFGTNTDIHDKKIAEERLKKLTS
jgi:PAS domain S-box-containing protein